MESGARQRVDDLWFSTDHKIPTGSVTEYFSEVSSGAVSLTGEVIGPFRLGQKLSYYSNRRTCNLAMLFALCI
jgi:immune inhibitor A